MIETWEDLVRAINARPPLTWVTCTAWAVGAEDPDGLEIRTKGGRTIYESARCSVGPRGSSVRLARLGQTKQGHLHQFNRWLKPDALVEVRSPVVIDTDDDLPPYYQLSDHHRPRRSNDDD